MSYRVTYTPLSADLHELSSIKSERLLILGRLDEQGIGHLSDYPGEPRCSVTAHTEHVRCSGIYRWEDAAGSWAVVVVGQQPGRPAYEIDCRYDDGDARAVIGLQQRTWDDAAAVAITPPVATAASVRLKGTNQLGVVAKLTFRAGSWQAHVRLGNGAQRYVAASNLEVVDDFDDDPANWVRGAPGPADDLMRTISLAKLSESLTDVLYSYASSKTIFRPYQFLPVIKLLESSTGRILVADEVGLGKTIEAGLIWNELDARAQTDRVLIVAPASLQQKWQSEMERRFDRSIQLLKPRDLSDRLDDWAAHGHASFQGIISIESLRRSDEILERMSSLQMTFDLVIVDEAHSMRNSSTAAHQVGVVLSELATHLVFLSATPLNLHRDDLYNLVYLLDPAAFPDREIFTDQLAPTSFLNAILEGLRKQPTDLSFAREALAQIRRLAFGAELAHRPPFQELAAIVERDRPLTPAESTAVRRAVAQLHTLHGVLTRTRKVDVPDAKAVREAHSVRVHWSDEERAFYDGIRDAYAHWAREQSFPPGFVMQMPLRQAASCIPAMKQLLAERQGLAPGGVVQRFHDLNEEGPAAENMEGLPEGPEVGHLMRPLDHDSKFEGLLHKLRDIASSGGRQVMLFSFFRRTLEYLASRLQQEFELRVMHGGVPVVDRQRIMDEFRSGEFDLLLVSQVGSEGLDFEFCNVLINYDLPWNPMQVEQRIGRLDRFGQKHEKIFIFNLQVPGTIETDIFERLYERIGIFRSSIGELEPIVLDRLEELRDIALDASLSDEQRAERSRQIAEAVESARGDIEEVQAHRPILTALDNLEIAGLSEHGPEDGRYVGAAELRAVLEATLACVDSELAPTADPQLWAVRGSVQLQQALAGHLSTRGQHARRILSLIGEGSELLATFDSSMASRSGVDLVSSRHPLIGWATDLLRSQRDTSRFTRCRINGSQTVRSALVQIDLVKTNGLTDQVELWVTAVDTLTRRPVNAIESIVLTAVTEGRVDDADTAVPDDIDQLVPLVAELFLERRDVVERERAAANAQRVAENKEARRASLLKKLAIRQRSIQELIAQGKSQGVVRMHRGLFDKIQGEIDGLDASFHGKDELSITSETLAVALVELYP